MDEIWEYLTALWNLLICDIKGECDEYQRFLAQIGITIVEDEAPDTQNDWEV